MMLPIVAMAALGPGTTPAQILLAIKNLVVIIFTAAAIIYFLVYDIMFLMARGEPGAVATARQGVLWGVVGVAVGILAIFIVDIVGNFF